MRGAHVVGVHWRGETNYPLTGDRAHRDHRRDARSGDCCPPQRSGVCLGHLGTAVSQQAARAERWPPWVWCCPSTTRKIAPPARCKLLRLALAALPSSISCRVAVVLDQCGDASSAIAHGWGARFGALVVSPGIRERGNGSPSGQPCPLSLWPEEDPRESGWRPPMLIPVCRRTGSRSSWRPHLSGADMWAGRVRVAEESATALRWTQRYSAERDPVHGASLGFSAALYPQLGGFGSMRTGEDRDLHPPRAVHGGLSDCL